ncbi:hypothetical protein BDQ94DRAFT_165127 [Aspergillus welwitschiae]|uniref:S-adenosyl-L-methionine-dependent methyltransferase n=1 Tax=Aspergillus welwitschiae TaxID=1341132 RepID=A0A3F3QJG0_9EURO|nr:hypothetical protein BDQ94DRAFT_165127 [Aspergillus welwitschiae]RDH39413.1 hypothetical protein BDQ94DRAFT_165127 [Aspergillus welwitschiae]
MNLLLITLPLLLPLTLAHPTNPLTAALDIAHDATQSAANIINSTPNIISSAAPYNLVSDLCTPTGANYCNLGIATYAPNGRVQLRETYVYDRSCRGLGALPQSMDTGHWSLHSLLPWTVEVDVKGGGIKPEGDAWRSSPGHTAGTNATLRILDAGAADGKWKGESPYILDRIALIDESGAGTWLRSLAEHYPNQKWSLHGIDIGSALFPPPSADGPIVDLQKHDIREPIPEHLHPPEIFDIIHQRYLVWGLRSAEWPQVLGNLRSVLKPGGWIQLVEAQWVDRDAPFDPVEFPNLAKMSEMQKWSTDAFGMNAYIAYELEELLRHSGFVNITKTSFAIGYGAVAREEQWKVTSAYLLVEGYRSLGHKMPPGGIPGVARTPAEFDAFLDDLRDEVLRHGYAPQLNIVIGQKPRNQLSHL